MLGEPSPVRSEKAVHDPVLGTHVFQRHEISLLDTPLLQRLRYISQTGFVYLTFPGARHSRFEHTLGATVLVDRFIRALNSRASRPEITPQETAELRVAALLHDCGHAFFSHASELVYRYLPPMMELKREPEFAAKGPGELLSYCIVVSQPFRAFFRRLCEKYDLNLDLNRIAGYIVGKPSNALRPFLAEMISGPFDMDKLDYIHRDAHATGLRLVVDLERFFYAIDLDQTGRLAIRSPEPLEQLIFSKMMLFATVYHHHKVKACDCMLKGAVDWSQARGSAIAGQALRAPADFLAVTDTGFLGERGNPLIRRLLDRDLLCRAAVISPDTLEAESGTDPHTGLYKLNEVAKDPMACRLLNHEIYVALPDHTRKSILPEEVWLDIPEEPSLKELALAKIIIRQGTTVPADRVFPTEGWLNAYGTFRARGHVFAPRSAARDTFDAAQDVFRSHFGLRFRTDLVLALCHLD
jgi:HD superfamily phosphohydrolase